MNTALDKVIRIFFKTNRHYPMDHSFIAPDKDIYGEKKKLPNLYDTLFWTNKTESFLDLYAGVKTDLHIYTIHHKFC